MESRKMLWLGFAVDVWRMVRYLFMACIPLGILLGLCCGLYLTIATDPYAENSLALPVFLVSATLSLVMSIPGILWAVLSNVSICEQV